MRLYPPAWGIGRKAIRDQEIGGYTFPPAPTSSLSPYVTQRDARFFPDPERFDPDRFTPEAKASAAEVRLLPFGGGARQCIGEPFAWMEGVLILATLAQRWRLRLVPGHRVEPQPLITLRAAVRDADGPGAAQLGQIGLFMKQSPTDFMNSPGYSWRSATIGSTFMAQRAGT